jgi:hypothetical protein
MMNITQKDNKKYVTMVNIYKAEVSWQDILNNILD